MSKGLNLGGGGGIGGGGGGLGLAGLFGAPGSQAAYDMSNNFLQAALANAQGSDSPALALLTPIVASMIGKRNEKLHSDFKKNESEAAIASLLGEQASNPRVRSYLDVLNSDNAPDALKTVAGSLLKKAIEGTPFGQTTSRRTGSRSSGTTPTGTSSSGDRLVGEIWIDGVLHGRDKNGTLRPYRTEDGNLATRSGKPEPRPSSGADDPLGLRTSPSQDDPLGLR